MTLRVDTIADEAGTGPASLTGQIAAKAFCVWAVDGTVANSQNISSVTDNGTGDWTPNYTSSFDSDNYSPLSTAMRESTNVRNTGIANSGIAAGSTQIECDTDGGSNVDPTEMYMAATGDLA